MIDVIFPQDFDFATELIVRALNELKFALVLMFVQELSLDPLSTLIVTVYNLEKASFIMLLQVFVNNYSCTFLMRTIDTSEITSQLM